MISTAAAAHFQRISEAYNPAAWARLHAAAPPILVYTDADEWRSYESVHGDPVLHIEVGSNYRPLTRRDAAIASSRLGRLQLLPIRLGLCFDWFSRLEHSILPCCYRRAHTQLRRWADVLLIAPLSANTLAKLSCGMADNLLTSVARAWELVGPSPGGRAAARGEDDAVDDLGSPGAPGDGDDASALPDSTPPPSTSQRRQRGKPLLVAPAMNSEMWSHPLTAPQLRVLTHTLGVVVIPPAARLLACGDVGVGAMASVGDIVEAVASCFLAT